MEIFSKNVLSAKQKPFSLCEDWFSLLCLSLLALALVYCHKKISWTQYFSRRPLGELIIPICQWLDTFIYLPSYQEVRGYKHVTFDILRVYQHHLWCYFLCRNTFVLLAFFPVFILDLVDLLSAQQMLPGTLLLQYNSTSLSSHCLGPVTTRAVCAPCVRVTVSAEGRDITYTELTPIPGQCLLNCEKDRKI